MSEWIGHQVELDPGDENDPIVIAGRILGDETERLANNT